MLVEIKQKYAIIWLYKSICDVNTTIRFKQPNNSNSKIKINIKFHDMHKFKQFQMKFDVRMFYPSIRVHLGGQYVWSYKLEAHI